MYLSNERAKAWKHGLKTNLVNQWLVCGILVAVCWAVAVPAIASNQVSQSEQAHLQMPLSTDDIRHLLMRTGIGARPADIVKMQGLSRRQAIDSIIEGISTEPDVPMPDWVSHPLPLYHARPDMEPEARASFNNQRNAEFRQLRQWWVLNILQTSSPQTERMVLFWHDLFATNYHSLGQQSLAMARQNQTFRKLGFGSWEFLIKAMIRDAALLKFLNSGSNHKASPNENLARELMELFVLGEGNYDENTVREAARSLTGHDTGRSHDLQFQLKTGAQDRADKQLFGKTGAFDGDDLVDQLLLQDAAPRFLATRFWHAFVSDLAPDTAWIDDQAMQFRRSNLDIASLYRNVLQSEAFWHKDNRGAMIKSPIDIVAGTARTLDYPMNQWQKMPQWQRIIGMNLFAPPDVGGWTEGAAFITPGYLLNRYKVVRQLTHLAASQAGKNSTDKNMGMVSSGTSEMGSGNDIVDKTMMDVQPNSMIPTGNAQLENSSPSTMERGIAIATEDQLTEKPDVDDDISTLKASAVHIQGGSANKKNGYHRLEITLDHLQTPGKVFNTVRMTIEKRNKKPMTLSLDSFSCWPDCIDPWPECAQIDKNFTASKKIIMPWVSIDSERWSTTHDHQCQFESLQQNEKILVSTLWVDLPKLLAKIKLTNRVQNNRDRWLPIIEFLEVQYRQESVNVSDTAYASFARSMDISPVYAKPLTALEPLTAPLTSVNNANSLMSELSAEGLLLHQLLLPKLSVEHVPNFPVNDVKRPDRYLKTVLEHPLFQLK